MVECPIHTCTSRRWYPAATQCDANEWRSMCHPLPAGKVPTLFAATPSGRRLPLGSCSPRVHRMKARIAVSFWCWKWAGPRWSCSTSRRISASSSSFPYHDKPPHEDSQDPSPRGPTVGRLPCTCTDLVATLVREVHLLHVSHARGNDAMPRK